MEVRSREGAEAFTTLDGSTIRVLLDATLGGAAKQSLAEASLEPGLGTQRHYHAESEEIYVFLEGGGEMEVEEDRRGVGAGDAVLIPAGAWHQITAGPEGARFLCCCAPPYSDADTFFA
ncbi:MAG TPA: cupin domain-containing protein [Gaiellaceae bacterium]|jgi:mannose-6-phosphate isomerase-like protein (cupin superfamily)|nr:cupin domain-containing protein [Gaiellaceae bacterium]